SLDSNDLGHDEQPRYDSRSGGTTNNNNYISNSVSSGRPSNTDSGFQDTMHLPE
ncbi:hypothetical protein BGZ94_006020, partial [Podila epigama]